MTPGYKDTKGRGKYRYGETIFLDTVSFWAVPMSTPGGGVAKSHNGQRLYIIVITIKVVHNVIRFSEIQNGSMIFFNDGSILFCLGSYSWPESP